MFAASKRLNINISVVLMMDHMKKNQNSLKNVQISLKSE